jgi:hypothetical protein
MLVLATKDTYLTEEICEHQFQTVQRDFIPHLATEHPLPLNSKCVPYAANYAFPLQT